MYLHHSDGTDHPHDEEVMRLVILLLKPRVRACYLDQDKPVLVIDGVLASI